MRRRRWLMSSNRQCESRHLGWSLAVACTLALALWWSWPGYLGFVAGGLALALVFKTRRVIERAAHANLQSERARASLTEILRDHHDLRTIVTAMNLNAELLRRHLDAGDDEDRVRRIADGLRHDVATCVASLQQIRVRTLEELAALEQPTPVDVHAVTSEVIDAVGQRFPGVALSSRVAPNIVATVAGGAPSLRRMMSNLLVNACEGDGNRGARSIEVAVEPDLVTGRVAITIADDGPGFLRAIVAGDGLGATTKAEGSGLGLSLAGAIARASGGALRLANRRSVGATVTIELAAQPVAGSTSGSSDATAAALGAGRPAASPTTTRFASMTSS